MNIIIFCLLALFFSSVRAEEVTTQVIECEGGDPYSNFK